MADPLKQFKIETLIPLEIGSLDLSYTNSALWMTIAAGCSVLLLAAGLRNKSLVPGRLQMANEMIYEFVAGMIRDNLGSEGKKFFPLIFSLFLFVLFGNLLGLVPYSFTFTSHIVINFALALIIFLTVTVYGIFRNGMKFFSIFAPPGIPFALAFVIVPIEIISFLIRPVTLSVRLFANMMAGHLVLKVFAGFSAAMIGLGIGGVVASILPMAFNVLFIAFELLVACLQAYVFAILSCIYLKDAIEIHH